jgi:hypothetical protein
MKTLTIILALTTTIPDFANDNCDKVECEKEVDFEELYG